MLAELYNRAECVNREVDPAVDVSEVRQLDPQRLVHRREVQGCVRMHPVLVQGVLGPREPLVARRPPERVV